jgi:hypothetical protein
MKNKSTNYNKKDYTRIIKNSELKDWKDWFFELSFEKGKHYYDIKPEIKREPWFKTHKINNTDTKKINRLLAGHTYTKKWLKTMKLSDTNLCDMCNTTEDEEHLIDSCSKHENIRNLPEFEALKGLLKESTLEGLKCLIKFINKSDINI